MRSISENSFRILFGRGQDLARLAHSHLYVAYLAPLLILDLALAQSDRFLCSSPDSQKGNNSPPTMAEWTSHPDCPAHVKTGLEACVRSLPPSYLTIPVALLTTARRWKSDYVVPHGVRDIRAAGAPEKVASRISTGSAASIQLFKYLAKFRAREVRAPVRLAICIERREPRLSS